MAKPATQIIPLVKPCSSTALRSYPSAYPSRLGSVIDNHFNCGGMIFFLWCLALHGVSYSRQSPWYLQAPPSRSPRIPLPGHTRKIEFPNTMSTFKFSLFGSNLSFAGILFFLILFRRCSFLLYTQHQLASFSTDLGCQVCPQLNNCPMDAGTEEWFQLHVELDRRRAAT